MTYRISSNKTRGYYFFIRPSNAGIIRMRVLFEGLYYFLKVQNLNIKTRFFCSCIGKNDCVLCNYVRTYTVRAPLYPAACIFFTPFFTAVYNQERLILQTTYVLKRGNSSKNAEVYNQERFQIKSGL